MLSSQIGPKHPRESTFVPRDCPYGSTPFHIFIIGAGLTGLALGQCLLKANVAFRIYEREKFDYSRQSSRVRLDNNGIKALRRILSIEQFKRLEAYSPVGVVGRGVHPVKLDAITGELLEIELNAKKAAEGGAFGVVSLDYRNLRELLLEGLERHIHIGTFNQKQTRSDGILVDFSGSPSKKCSIIVGADGMGSKVREELLSHGHNFPATIDGEQWWIYGKTPLTVKLLERLHHRVENEMMVVQDTSKHCPLNLVVEPIRFQHNKYRSKLPDDYIYWALGARKDYFSKSGMGLGYRDICDGDRWSGDLNDVHIYTSDLHTRRIGREKAVSMTRKITAHWHPSLRCLFDQQDTEQTLYQKVLISHPVIPRFIDRDLPKVINEGDFLQRVTLIGDSAHAMAPISGRSAGFALWGVVQLANALSEVYGENNGRKQLDCWEAELRYLAFIEIQQSINDGQALFGMRAHEELSGYDEYCKRHKKMWAMNPE